MEDREIAMKIVFPDVIALPLDSFLSFSSMTPETRTFPDEDPAEIILSFFARRSKKSIRSLSEAEKGNYNKCFPGKSTRGMQYWRCAVKIISTTWALVSSVGNEKYAKRQLQSISKHVELSQRLSRSFPPWLNAFPALCVLFFRCVFACVSVHLSNYLCFEDVSLSSPDFDDRISNNVSDISEIVFWDSEKLQVYLKSVRTQFVAVFSVPVENVRLDDISAFCGLMTRVIVHMNDIVPVVYSLHGSLGTEMENSWAHEVSTGNGERGFHFRKHVKSFNFFEVAKTLLQTGLDLDNGNHRRAKNELAALQTVDNMCRAFMGSGLKTEEMYGEEREEETREGIASRTRLASRKKENPILVKYIRKVALQSKVLSIWDALNIEDKCVLEENFQAHGVGKEDFRDKNGKIEVDWWGSERKPSVISTIVKPFYALVLLTKSNYKSYDGQSEELLRQNLTRKRSLGVIM